MEEFILHLLGSLGCAVINLQDNERSLNEIVNKHFGLEGEDMILLGSHPSLRLYERKLAYDGGTCGKLA